jgi:uncharacterized membrane protein YjjP (DUF1212 family)
MALSVSGSRSRLGSAPSLRALTEAPAAAEHAEGSGVKEQATSDAPSRLQRLQRLLRLAASPSGARTDSAAAAAAAAEYTALLALLELLRVASDRTRPVGAAANAAAADDAAAPARRRRQRLRRTARLEDVLMGLARALHDAGCPAWRLQARLVAAARGLGLAHTSVHVFPHHVTFTFSRRLSADSAGAKTLSVSTSPGLDVGALEQADALARRLSAFATSSGGGAASAARNGEGDEAAVAAAAAELAAGKWGGGGAAPGALAAAALDAAASGPGFFRDGGADSGSDSSSGADSDSDGSEPDLEAAALLRPRSSGADEDEDAAADADDEASPAALRRDAFVSAALDEALRRLRALAAAPPRYAAAPQCVAAGAASAGCALVFWGASWYDGALSSALGAAVAALGLFFYGAWGSRSGLRRVAGYELAAAFLVSLASRLAAHAAAHGATPPVCVPALRLGALQWLLQGWDLTAAIIELTNRNAALVGASHLLVAVIVSAMIGFGIDLGDALSDLLRLRTTLPGGADVCVAGIAPHWYLPVFAPAAAALCVQMAATRAQTPQMVCIALVTLAITLYVPAPPLLSTLLAALACGYAANAHANRSGAPAVGGAAIGVFVLVPDGMAALNGISAVMYRGGGTSDGEGGGASMPVGLTLSVSVLQSAVAIGAGLFIASLLLAPRELSHVTTPAARHRSGGGSGAAAVVSGAGPLARLRRRRREQRAAHYARTRALPLFF